MTIIELIEVLTAVAFTVLIVTAGVAAARTTRSPLRMVLLTGVLLLALIAILRGDAVALEVLGGWFR